jgi:hypothetical protein
MGNDDAFWAAKQVMAFTEGEIRGIVRTGEYTDPAATDWVVRCLMERRNKIGRAFFQRVLPLDRFTVRDGQLAYEDLTATHFGIPARVAVRWNTFDNASGHTQPVDGAATLQVPSVGCEYLAAELSRAERTVRVYLRKSLDKSTWEVVGRDTAEPEVRLLTRR